MNKTKITYGFPQSIEEVKSAYKFVQQQLEINGSVRISQQKKQWFFLSAER